MIEVILLVAIIQDLLMMPVLKLIRNMVTLVKVL
nr:MAG TPA: hypothetical protein [Bacteriophage sp.]